MSDDIRAQSSGAGALPADGRSGSGLRGLGGGLVRGEQSAAAGQPAPESGAGGGPRPPVVIRMRTGRGQNDREHWSKRSRRVKKERGDTRWAVRAGFGPASGVLPCIVTLTRVAPSNGLDGDNLQGALKACRDGVADWLGVDDRDPRVTWRYEQRRGKTGQWAVEVHVA